ncbi:MAG: BCCT family transporter [Synergistales bacterium]|nr:BCCT family transporter [Synergistales bacterium]
MWLKENIVFVISFIMVGTIITFGVVAPREFDALSSAVHEGILEHFSWGYTIAPFIFLVFSLTLAFSKYGRIKLGKDSEKPQYSYFAWFSMLFAAGMGIGLVFWGVSEPLMHYTNPPAGIAGSSADAARFAMRHVFFHWGLQPWAIYVVMSLSIAYFCFRRGMPPLISSALYPLLGERIYGLWGYAVDILAVFAVVFGIATSLGLGTMQISSGLAYVFPAVPDTMTTWFAIIAIVTVMYMISAMRGLDRGIQVLSRANIGIAAVLLFAMLFIGPTTFILNVLITTTGDYLSSLLSMSLSANPFQGYQWTKDWTLFFWATWISWSPFVGLFVASISRGRTIREFVLGALLVPSLLTFIWFAVFGGAAFDLEIRQGYDIAAATVENISTGLFNVFTYYPLSWLLTGFALMLLTIFFVTSADSSTLVLAMMTTQGELNPRAYRKFIWGIMQSSVAAILLASGGLNALRKMAISSALPFTIIMLVLCYSLWKGVTYEYNHEYRQGLKDTTAP